MLNTTDAFVGDFTTTLLLLKSLHCTLAKNGPFYPGGKNGVIGVRKVLQTG